MKHWLGEALWWLRMRWRPPAVVAWGGRPGLDLQVGSVQDRRRARRLDHAARQRLAMIRLSITIRDGFTPAMRAFGKALRDIEASFAPLRRAVDELGPITPVRRPPPRRR